MGWEGHLLGPFRDVQTHVNCWVANGLGIEAGELPHLLAAALSFSNGTNEGSESTTASLESSSVQKEDPHQSRVYYAEKQLPTHAPQWTEKSLLSHSPLTF